MIPAHFLICRGDDLTAQEPGLAGSAALAIVMPTIPRAAEMFKQDGSLPAKLCETVVNPSLKIFLGLRTCGSSNLEIKYQEIDVKC